MFKLLKKLDVSSFFVFILCLFFIVLQVQCDIKLPNYTGSIIGLIRTGAGTSEIWNVGIKMLIVSLISIFSTITISYLASYISNKFARNIRTAMFKKVNEFSSSEINKFSVASLITRSTNDVQQIQSVLFMIMRFAFSAPLLAISALKQIINKNLTLTWITGLAVLIIFLMILLMIIFVVPKFKSQQKLTDELNLTSRETLTGVRVIRAYNSEEIMENKFEKVNNKLTKNNLFINISTSLMMPGMQLVISLLSLAIVWVGAYLINAGSLSFENMSVFTQYAMQILMSFMMLTMLFVFIPRGIVSAKRINKVLETESSIKEIAALKNSENEETLNTQENLINTNKVVLEFKEVCFKYPNAEEYVLKDINFSVKSGETLALIGSTGSGKSTLVNLITRFFDATSGEIKIFDKNVKNYSLEELYNYIGLVPQKANLFAGTIKENLLVGKENATEEEIDNALKISESYDFVYNFEDNINHEINQGGKNLSGGQKQRLCIARALIKNPKIYIFDDSFSALDYKTDKLLRENINKFTQDSIKVIVAQRIGTIMNADQIIVLNEGNIVGIGKHKDLLKTCKEYQEIALSQLSKEEL